VKPKSQRCAAMAAEQDAFVQGTLKITLVVALYW
jgi:hypothetical protein